MPTRQKVIMISLSFILLFGVFSFFSLMIISLKQQLYDLNLSSYVKLPVKLALQEIDDDFRNNHNDRAYVKFTILKKVNVRNVVEYAQPIASRFELCCQPSIFPANTVPILWLG